MLKMDDGRGAGAFGGGMTDGVPGCTELAELTAPVAAEDEGECKLVIAEADELDIAEADELELQTNT